MLQTFNPFVDFSDLNLEELLEKRIEMYKKLQASTPLVRPQVQIIVQQLEQMIEEKSMEGPPALTEDGEEKPKKDEDGTTVTIGEIE